MFFMAHYAINMSLSKEDHTHSLEIEKTKLFTDYSALTSMGQAATDIQELNCGHLTFFIIFSVVFIAAFLSCLFETICTMMISFLLCVCVWVC